jgi:predicted AlkP superfamily phosphohydrolase/phosphomutase
MTGLNPGNHGVYYFLRRKENSYEFEFTNSLSGDGKTLWKISAENGKRCITINVPMTYPPEKIDSVFISGMDAPGVSTAFTHPPGIYSELKREIGEYTIESDSTKLFRSSKYTKALQDLAKTVDNRHKAVKYLMKKYPWDLFTVVFTATDRVQHHFWRFMDKAHLLYNENESDDLKNAILRIYQKMDVIIGDIRDSIDQDTTLVVMSDHGAGPSSNRTVLINNWLHELGLLHYKEEDRSNPLRLLYFKVKSDFLWRFHSVLKRTLPRETKDFFRRYFPSVSNKIRTFGQSSAIDWTRTKAYSTETTPSIRINVKGRYPSGIVEPGQEYEELRDHVTGELQNLRDPENQDTVVEQIYRREEVYHGKYLDEAPDIIFRWRKNGYTHRFSRSAPGKEAIQILSAKDLAFAESVSRPSGVHTPDGIVILHGKGVKKDSQIKKAQIMDLTPTILYSLGVPIPRNMDGSIIREAFEEAYLKDNQPVYIGEGQEEYSKRETSYSDEDNAIIEERLRGLGYIE